MVRIGHRVSVVLLFALVAACSNGRGSVQPGSSPAEQPPPATQFSVAASVSGLRGTGLVLQNNGGDDVGVDADGAVLFPQRLNDGDRYDVTVLAQPSAPTQICTVTNGSGTIAGANVTNVVVACAAPETPSFRVRGVVKGLEGSGLVLEINQAEDLAIESAGEFEFATPLASGAEYTVRVLTEPTDPAQTCTVANGAGTIASADVTNVAVTCSAHTFAIGGRVQGLLGTGLSIQNNSGAPFAIAEAGNFTFPQRLPAESTYSISIATQPTSPPQTCAIENATGTITNADVTDIVITCTTQSYTIGGTITGLAGSGLRLRANEAGRYRATASGPFQFPTAVPSGTSYTVEVEEQPRRPSQTCTVTNATGVVADANVTNIEVTCTASRFTIGGRVHGLQGSGLTLLNNDGDELAIASDGVFTFGASLESGAAYEVSVATQPSNPLQICSVAHASGTVGDGNVTNVRVDCAAQTFPISGTVSGLLGSGLVLRNNNGDPVEVDSDGGFTFPREIASGANYNVTVHRQPSNPTQACTVSNGSGTVTTAAISNVSVSCTTSSFAVGGRVSGLAGTGLVIANGVEQLPVSGDGPFTFATALPSGTAYGVTIATQPSDPEQVCTISNGSGTIGASNITNIEIACTTVQYTIGGTISGLAGQGLRLQNNGGPPLPIGANGAFTFPASISSGSPYSVAVLNQPQNPTQQCVVSQGSGTATANVTNVRVECTTSTFTVGGNVSGLSGGFGGPLVLQNNGDTVMLNVDGSFTFGVPVLSGGTYNVILISDPMNRQCTVANGQGTVTNANVTTVNVMCIPQSILP